MRRKAWRRVGALLADQHQVITRGQALDAGLTDADIRKALATGGWVRSSPGIYRPSGAQLSAEARLVAACLSTGGWTSHEWAAWLWELGPKPEGPPTVTVPVFARNVHPGVTIHRHAHPKYVTPPRLRKVPCTDAVTTVVDFATVAEPDQVDRAIDDGLARGLFTVVSLLGELERLGTYRQPGIGPVRRSLLRRGLIGAPQPSRLESMVLRLFATAGIRPIRAEEPVWVGRTRYRLDFVVVEGLAVEVDGYVYHANTDSLRSDLRRRNHVGNRPGWTLLVYTWKDIVEEGDRVIGEVRAAMRALAAGGARLEQQT